MRQKKQPTLQCDLAQTGKINFSKYFYFEIDLYKLSFERLKKNLMSGT